MFLCVYNIDFIVTRFYNAAVVDYNEFYMFLLCISAGPGGAAGWRGLGRGALQGGRTQPGRGRRRGSKPPRPRRQDGAGLPAGAAGPQGQRLPAERPAAAER